MSLIAELKRRNVIRVGAAYVVASWLVIQVVETIFPVYGLSDAAIRFAITALAVGFIPAVIFAWVFELTPEGLKRGQDVDHSASKSTETGKKLDKAIIVVLVLAVGYFAFDKFILSGSREQAIAEAAREEGRAESIIEAFGENSIAVLPFVDMSSDKDQEYMSDGIAEELLNLLTKVPKLRVVSRSSAFFFKYKDIDIPTVAQKLNVAYILEGSVRTAGDQLRITAQLIDATSDSHVWSETYDRQLENVFDIQDEIANAVVDELKVQFLGGDLQSIRFDEEAYRLVLQARYLWYRRAPGDEEQALALYEHALEIDPTSAPAWTGLSVALAAHALDGRIDSEQGFARAHEAAEKALELGPNLADAHIRMAQANLRAKLYDEAVENMRIAYELDPDSPLVLAVLADQKLREYRVQEALDLYKRAQEVDPMSALWFENTFRPLLLVATNEQFGRLEANSRAYFLGRAASVTVN